MPKYGVFLPNPHDPQAEWVEVGLFKSKVPAIRFIRETLGGDSQGRIGVLSHIPDEGWLVDLPNPEHPGDAWIFVESFDRKKDAVLFVRDSYGGDGHGRVGLLAVGQEEESEDAGPREWSPRWEKRRGR